LTEGKFLCGFFAQCS